MDPTINQINDELVKKIKV